MTDQFSIGARQIAKQTGVAARGDVQSGGGKSLLRIGKVTVEDDGIHTVAVLDDAGVVTALTYENVRAVPESAYEVGAVVWLVFFEGTGGAHPVILAAGGSGGGPCSNIADWGALTD